MRTLLCFGIKVNAARWAAAIGIQYGQAKFQTCPFCSSGASGNFCSNCGQDLRKGLPEIGPEEVATLTEMHWVSPPRPLVLMPLKDELCICQVLASADGPIASAARPPKQYQWDGVASAIASYVAAAGVTDVEPRLLAITEEGK
jgi:hypothetical protein